MRKIALVTGGNSGIGYATAKLLKEKGFEVYISGRNPDSLKQAADALGVHFLVADMSDPKAVKSLASHFLETGLDVLVNNAGHGRLCPFTNVTLEDYSETFNTNVRGPYFLIQELLPALEKREGCITNVSSIVVNHGRPTSSHYAASKGAVDAFTRSLVVELSPRKIRINAVAPGAIDTAIYTKQGFTPDLMAAMKKKLETNTPLGRIGRPEEVAQVIVAQVESTFVTGAVWDVDGGVSAISA